MRRTGLAALDHITPGRVTALIDFTTWTLREAAADARAGMFPSAYLSAAAEANPCDGANYAATAGTARLSVSGSSRSGSATASTASA